MGNVRSCYSEPIRSASSSSHDQLIMSLLDNPLSLTLLAYMISKGVDPQGLDDQTHTATNNLDCATTFIQTLRTDFHPLQNLQSNLASFEFEFCKWTCVDRGLHFKNKSLVKSSCKGEQPGTQKICNGSHERPILRFRLRLQMNIWKSSYKITHY